MAKFVDAADWSGVPLKSHDVGTRANRKHSYPFGGVCYATEGEMLLAKLLIEMGVPFTPNVQFVLKPPPGRRSRTDVIFVPDFIFNKQAYIWTDENGREELIHGLEAKGMNPDQFTAKGRAKVRLLRETRGINVRLISTKEIRAYLRSGTLPMRPLK